MSSRKRKKQVSQLQTSLIEQRKQLDREKYFRTVLFARLNDLEQYSRKNNVRVFGIPDKDRGEKAHQSEQLVLNLFKEKLGINWLNHDNIEIAHRTGQYSEKSNRAIIVKFTSRKAKNEIIMKRSQLKGSKVSIAEDLTVENVRRLRELSALDVCAQSWSFGGKLFCKNGNDEKIEVRSNDVISENIFKDAAHRRTSAMRQGNDLRNPGASQFKQNDNEREKILSRQEIPKEGELASKNIVESSKNDNSIKNSQNSKVSESMANQNRDKKSGSKDLKNNKKSDGSKVSKSNSSSPVSKKKYDSTFSKKEGDSSTSVIDMDICEVMGDGAASIVPQHSSTPTQDDKIKKIAARAGAGT